MECDWQCLTIPFRLITRRGPFLLFQTLRLGFFTLRKETMKRRLNGNEFLEPRNVRGFFVFRLDMTNRKNVSLIM